LDERHRHRDHRRNVVSPRSLRLKPAEQEQTDRGNREKKPPFPGSLSAFSVTSVCSCKTSVFGIPEIRSPRRSFDPMGKIRV
jgi:hypothetical protein